MPSVRESVMDDMKTALEAITEANGYKNTISSVQRWSQHEQDFSTVPTIIIVAGREVCEDKPDFITTCRLTVQGMLYINQEPDTGIPTDKVLNEWLEDIIKALKMDVTRGGNAIDTHIVESEHFEMAEDMPYAGIIFNAQILFRHSQTDSTVAA